MNSNIKIKNQQGGFIKLIILFIAILFLLKYFDVSVASAIDWIKNLLDSVL